MKRRTFLSTLAASAALPSLLRAGSASVDYAPGVIENALAEGKTLFVDYAADWCSTCARQERIINALREANPDYDKHVMFVRVDWDDYGNKPVSQSRRIPRRSTLLVLKGDQELGRIVAGTSEAEIKALLDTALKAATSA